MKKQIAIAGFGVEGHENLRYFREKFPNAEFWIFDENPNFILPGDVKKFAKFGGNFAEFSDEKFAEKFDLILRSPSVAPKKISRKSLSKNGEISSATNWFFANCPAKIIGITGSKGKGTTCSFVAEILREFFAKTNEKNAKSLRENSEKKNENFRENREVFLLGNIGIPALSELEKIRKNDAVVYELSSFQLWDLAKSPHIAGATIIEPDHLDVHENFAEYVAAKINIFAHQTAEDFAIFNADDEKTREMAEKSNGQKIAYPNENFANVSGDEIRFGKRKILAKNKLKLPGEHNVRNALLALDLTYFYLENSDDFDAEIFAKSAENGLKNFAGLEHRLKFISEKNGAKFYDDSIATTPGSAIAAINSFAKNPKILILGGSDKGANYAELGDKIRENKNVEIVVAMGGNSRKIVAEITPKIDGKNTKIWEFPLEKLKKNGVENSRKNAEKKSENKNPFDEIFAEIAPEIRENDFVILSPAAASFDLFKNYADRGEKFAEAVKKL